MKLARGLVVLSSIVFGVTGLGYVIAPGALLAVVGIASGTTTDFLLRTEGVALLAASAFLWSVRDGSAKQIRFVLSGLAFYYIVGSIVDLQAFAQAVVGVASAPSAIARIVLGLACLLAAVRQEP